ncbi:hypothetical protein [Kriegella aquimaris]|uniref:Lipocalin-like domain-containing protein n=1 Tax=Kriegella aquimaris TaxID=192904 RepID=A0A1G9JLF3_9FLAO|nr:hypothetical protein [Kriegella aquimaris]SDL38096.1 hypothetical protein SAMN04488514_101601 [Kriegella aquimaris]
MKRSTILFMLTVLMLLTACKFEGKIVQNPDSVEFTGSELFGRWILTSNIEDSENSKKLIIRKIDLKDDFSAEIEILDGIGYKTVPGNWKIKEKQKIGAKSFNISLKSDVVLTFDLDATHREIVSLSVKEVNNKKMLTSQKDSFEKE